MSTSATSGSGGGNFQLPGNQPVNPVGLPSTGKKTSPAEKGAHVSPSPAEMSAIQIEKQKQAKSHGEIRAAEVHKAASENAPAVAKTPKDFLSRIQQRGIILQYPVEIKKQGYNPSFMFQKIDSNSSENTIAIEYQNKYGDRFPAVFHKQSDGSFENDKHGKFDAYVRSLYNANVNPMPVAHTLYPTVVYEPRVAHKPPPSPPLPPPLKQHK